MTVYQFGQFRVSVDGPDYLMMALPGTWKQYRELSSDSTFSFSIHLFVDTLPIELPANGHWSYTNKDQQTNAVFFDHGAAQFRLSYDHRSTEYTITIQRNFPQTLPLALHYTAMTALTTRCIGLHGVTLRCNNQHLILSAPSGTGKTTLAGLLHDYCDAEVINGDYAFLSISDEGRVIYEPSPFCGSSNTCRNQRFPVDRIVFLGQAPDNTWQSLTVAQGYARLIENIFIPGFDQALYHMTQENALSLISTVPTSSFRFAPTREAAALFVRSITM